MFRKFTQNDNSTKEKELCVMKYEDCYAKTFVDGEGKKNLGIKVFEHCVIVGEIAKRLLETIPEQIRNKIFPVESHFIASLHDIGKVCPTFAKKLFKEVGDERKNNFNYINLNEKEWGGHATVSQSALKDKKFGFYLDDYIPKILGKHHGYSNTGLTKSADAEQFGGVSWQKERVKLVNDLKDYFKCSFTRVESFEQEQAIAGLTSVADWIGSGEFFEDPNIDWSANIKPSLENAGFISPKIKPNLSFKEIFGFGEREIQIKFIEKIKSPGVYVLEAPMGIGKTEAALFVAYKMLSSQNNTGIYFALPTQLTSNKIYDRFDKFLEKILTDDSSHKNSLLLHSSAWLVNSKMGEEGEVGADWFNSSKRGILAPFAVGTIDQALMACMNVKHCFVRAFGLVGKVVILDEVHSYDAYTGTIMDNLIAMLKKLGCTVIILSATLTKSRTQQMLKIEGLKENSYPLITVIDEKGNVDEVGIKLETHSTVDISIINDDEIATKQALEASQNGQQVLFIQNTVKEAQETYKKIVARVDNNNVECFLLHSRFTAQDRQEKEDKYINFFGKNGWNERNKKGRILVGTQVLEQSLDIDADLLITKFCPTDMLLQRLGRLWRHKETPRNKNAKCEAIIIAPKLEDAIKSHGKCFGKTFYVYNPYVLCRSLEVWQDIKQILLPNNIRNLIEDTYREREEVGEMKEMINELEKKRQALRQFALNAQSQHNKGKSDNIVQTRYSEMDSCEVLLLKKFIPEKDYTKITLFNDENIDIPIKSYKLSKQERKKIAIQLMQNIVKVSVRDAPVKVSYKFLKERGFGSFIYLGNEYLSDEDEVWLRIAKVDEGGELKSIDGNQIHNKNKLFYNKQIGYFKDE